MSETDLSDFETVVSIYAEQFGTTLDFAQYDPDTPENILTQRQASCTAAINNVRALEQWHDGDPSFLHAARSEAGERIKGIHDALKSLGGLDE